MQDIGIVLLPNKECKDFSNQVMKITAKQLSGYKLAKNDPHITIIHIANLDDNAIKTLEKTADQFFTKYKDTQISFNVTGLEATGGTPEAGYKWIDLQLHTPNSLKSMRKKVIKTFCPMHNGLLTRMNDDQSNFIKNSQSKQDIDYCGVAYTNYTPHITSWYINLPNEEKTTELQNIANNSTLQNAMPKTCFATEVALVELGRNGNATKILKTYPLQMHEPEHTDAIILGVVLLGVFMIALKIRNYFRTPRLTL
jgi:hypothetical protein